jgi:hypothetical protein
MIPLFSSSTDPPDSPITLTIHRQPADKMDQADGADGMDRGVGSAIVGSGQPAAAIPRDLAHNQRNRVVGVAVVLAVLRPQQFTRSSPLACPTSLVVESSSLSHTVLG